MTAREPGHGTWRSCVAWTGVTVAGQALTLHLIQAGPRIRYQHYASIADLDAVTALLLVAWIVTVGAGLWRRRRLVGIVGHPSPSWLLRLPTAVLLFVAPSAALSRAPAAYVAELALATVLQSVNLAAVVLAATALPDGAAARIARAYQLLDDPPASGPRCTRTPLVTVIGAAWVFGLTATLALLVYERVPHVPDEVVYLYQARTFASGALSTPAPPEPRAFTVYMMPTLAERWYSPFPPGWPAVLAIGVMLDLHWLVNPLLAGLNTILAHALVRALYGGRVAFVVVLFLCISPWHLFMAMSLMSHTLTMTLALCAALAALRARHGAPHRWMFAAGVGTGLLSLVRPLDSVAVVLGLGCASLPIARRAGRSTLLVFGVGIVAAGSLVLPYNARLTGSPLVMPMDTYYSMQYGPNANALGFGPERGLGWELDAFPGHSPVEAVANVLLNLFSVNVELLGWGTGSLILVIALVCSNCLHGRDYTLIAGVALVVAAYSLYWYSGGPDFGARYWFLTLLPLLVLSARGVDGLRSTLRNAELLLPAGEGKALAALGLLGVLSIALYVPWRAADKYAGYLGMRPTITTLASEHGFGRSLVLIRGQEHPDYQAAWSNNPLDLDGDVPIYARYLDDASVTRLRQAFPDRPLWIVDGPSITHDTYRVHAGPILGSPAP